MVLPKWWIAVLLTFVTFSAQAQNDGSRAGRDLANWRWRNHHTPTPKPTPKPSPSATVQPSASPAASPVRYGTASDGTPLTWLLTMPEGKTKAPFVATVSSGHFNHENGVPDDVEQAILAAGFGHVHILHRYAPPTKLPGQTSKGQYPDQTDDLEIGLAALKADPRCVGIPAIMGGSGGANLALMMGVKGLVSSVVAFSPPTDLVAMANCSCPVAAVATNYAPTTSKQTDGSPIIYLPNKRTAPVMSVFYEKDAFPDNQRTGWNTACTKYGVENDAQLIPGQGHSWIASTHVNWLGFIQSHMPVTPPTATPAPSVTPSATVTPIATSSPTAVPTASATATVAQSHGLGVTYLVTSDTVERPMSVAKVKNLSVWANPRVKCAEFRSSWDRIEQSKGVYYWDFLDEGVAQSKSHGMKVRFATTAGVDTPKYVCDEDPKACFNIIDTNGNSVPTSIPWNPTFQKYFGAFLKALGDRYDADIVQIDMTGYVRRAEGYFVKTPEEQAAVELSAKAHGYPDAHTAWITSAQWITDQYNKYFPHAAFVCVTGSPWPQPDDTSMASLVSYGATKYAGRFGAATHGLTSKQPADGGLYMTLPRTIRIGAQTGTTLGDDVAEGKGAVDRALRAGAEWLELRPADCDNPKQAPNLDAFNAAVLK